MKHLAKLPLGEPLRIAIVGAGGNGAQMASGLAQIAVAQASFGGQPLEVVIYDDDCVSEANVGRQLFSPVDIGRPKAEVLVERINSFYGFSWEARPVRAAPDTFARSSLYYTKAYSIVVGAVDSAESRRVIQECIFRMLGTFASSATYWLDVGNRQRSGQVVLGAYQAGEVILPGILELYPELSSPDFTEQDQGPSCSLPEALAKQDLFVNREVTTPALHLLWELIHKRMLGVHGVVTNLETMRRMPLPVDPASWLRMNPGLKLEAAEPFLKAA